MRTVLSLCAGTLCLVLTAADVTGVADRPRTGSLTTVFTNGVALDDTNDDSFADAVLARVIVPASPAAEDIESAVNIAGRLGHETMALTLPLVVREDEIGDAKGVAFPILVGRRNTAIGKLVERGALDTKSLTAGQGLIAWVKSPLGGADGLAVVGADDEGTLAAGLELAAHLPRAWSMSGITLQGIEDQVAKVLRAANVASVTTSVPSVIVDAGRRGLAAVNVQVTVSDADAARAVRALEDVDTAHRRGQDARTLNFTSVAETRIQVGGRGTERAVVRRSGLNGRTLTPPIDPDELATDSPGDRGRITEAAPVATRTFDLTNAFSIDGWFGDAYTDLIPDRVDSVLVLGPDRESLGASHLAARLGLESTGVTLPITRIDSKIRDASREPSPILVGRANALVQQLVKIGKARLDDLQPGDGVVQVVPRAFGATTATVVAGADEAGTEAASVYLGRRVPYVWDVTRGASSMRELAQDAARFFQAKTPAGQAALAVREFEAALATLKGKTIDSFDARVFVESPDPQLAAHLTSLAQTSGLLTGAGVKVAAQGVTDPVPVFEETIDVPWEVDDFWTHVKSEVLPKVTAGAKVDLEARLSESPAVRRKLVEEVRDALTKAGAASPRVRVLSAYKQGFLWLTEDVMPALKNKGARSIHINIATYKTDVSKKYKFYTVPTRWLHELYLADEIFQRDLGIPKENFALELVDNPKEIYVLEAKDAAGKVVHQASFSPTFVEREYLEKFPGWSRVPVWTGHITATVNGTTVSDARIETDPERFWDHYQGKVLPRIYDHVMQITDKQPMPDKQPFHRDLDIEVWMSEPDFKIGLDEEIVSSLESLHEDLYFVTLDFFDALGRTTVRRRLAAPGKIYPIIHPERPGRPGQVRILYAGNASTRPKIEIGYHEKGTEKPQRINVNLDRIEASAPALNRAVVRADRVRSLQLQIEARDDQNAARAVDALDALASLHAAGLYRDALSYAHVDRIDVEVGVRDARTRRALPFAGGTPPSNVRTAAAKPALPLVTWDHIISPDESEELVGKLAAFPEVHAYKAGQSYRGRNISIAEITAPMSSELVSLAKATTFKPTIFITGRQHANEVSSTSHILRLGELLVTDAAYKDILKRVNVVLHPVENPDGAQMAYDLQKLTPAHMLHAGRYSALGMDVASQVGQADPLLPESRVRMSVWRDWLPDIYLNPHGYPAHEWVQQFAGYVPPGFRIYLSSRGWYTTVSTLRDPRYPMHARATEAIRESIVREINSNPDVRAMDLRHQARYRKWAFGFQPFVYNQEIYKDTAIYYSDPETGEPSGSRRAGGGRGGGGGGGRGDAEGGGPSTGSTSSPQAGSGPAARQSMGAWPQVTYFNGGTETPDETAQGAWLDLVTKPGFSYLMASVKYLRDGHYRIDRIEEDGQRDAATRIWYRQRPVMPASGGGRSTSTGGQ